MTETNEKIKEILAVAYKAIDDKFGQDIVMLDIAGVSVMAEYFIIATAANQSQLTSIADEIMEKLHKQGMKVRHSEGYRTSKWVLLDFGSIIAHIFLKEEREFYNLERIWGDAARVMPEDIL